MTDGTQLDGSAALRRGSAIGIVAAVGVAILFMLDLLPLWQGQRAAAMMPLGFGAGILFCGLLAFLQGGQVAGSSFGGRQVLLLAAVALCGAAVWMRVPYGLIIALLIGCCFGIIGRRSWRVMIGVLVGSELLAYGVFKFLLGIPIH